MKTPPLLPFIYLASYLIECTVTLPQSSSSKQLFTLKTLPSPRVATSPPTVKSIFSPSQSPFSFSPPQLYSSGPLSSSERMKLSQAKYIKDLDDTSGNSSNKSAVGAFSFTYKVKDGNSTIERSEKQQPNGSVVGYYLVKNLISGFLRSIFYEANAETFKASVYSNKPGDVNYTFPTESPPPPSSSAVPVTTETASPMTGQVIATTTMSTPTTSGSSGEGKLETTTISATDSLTTEAESSKQIVTSIEPDFELVTAVIVDTVDTTTIKDMATESSPSPVETTTTKATTQSIEEGEVEEEKEVTGQSKEATTSGAIVATGTSSSASGEDITMTTTTMASVTSATSNSILGGSEGASTEGTVNEVASEAISLDPLTIPGGPIVSPGEDASTSSPLITTESSVTSITTTTTAVTTETPSSSQIPVLPQLWYEYEILLNGGRFHRSESTDPITGKLIGSYILLMDSTAAKLTDPTSSTTSSTSVSPSTVTTSPPPPTVPPTQATSPTVPEASATSPVDISEAVTNSLQLLLQSSTTLEPQVQPQLEQEGSTSQAVPVTTTVTSVVMSSTPQSLPAGTLVAGGSTEEVIRRLRRLRKRHHNHRQQQSSNNNNNAQLRQQSNRPNVQQAGRSNYTSSQSGDRGKRKQVKQVNTLTSKGDAREG